MDFFYDVYHSITGTESLADRGKGVAVEFMVHNWELELQKLFGDQYNETTTFVDLATLLWGPPESRFDKTVDLFGHATMIASTRDGKAGVSLCTAIAKTFPPAVSDATHFISWSWRYSVKKFIRTLQEYCRVHALNRRDVYVWICFVCNNQFDWLSAGGQDGVNAFGSMLTHIGRVVCVVDNYVAKDAVYFKRLWPVFEVFTACTKKVPIDLALMEDAKDQLIGATLIEAGDAIVVDVMSAQATDPSDEKRIKEMIADESGAATRTNDTVKELFVTMIAKLLLSNDWKALREAKGQKDAAEAAKRADEWREALAQGVKQELEAQEAKRKEEERLVAEAKRKEEERLAEEAKHQEEVRLARESYGWCFYKDQEHVVLGNAERNLFVELTPISKGWLRSQGATKDTGRCHFRGGELRAQSLQVNTRTLSYEPLDKTVHACNWTIVPIMLLGTEEDCPEEKGSKDKMLSTRAEDQARLGRLADFVQVWLFNDKSSTQFQLLADGICLAGCEQRQGPPLV
mmetsp:Transcript_49792/g.113092  ORF Transcript_49792/g.113092 Transcript_49792/m.113092 type:complete len:516 (-) Transcript_49792:391-1938(-)